MGGTSTDVSHFAGEYERTFETEVAGVRLRAPMMAIHTVAAGGGSVLSFDGARYRVGPESAGAQPGPACYQNGGPLTVTDANVMLGKLQPDFFPAVFGPDGDLPIDGEIVAQRFTMLAKEIGQATGTVPTAAEVASGYVAIAVEKMAQAIKKISVQRGYDLADYALCCFGSAGGQHACPVADALGMTRVLVHPYAGVLSAYGMGLANLATERQMVVDAPLSKALEPALDEKREALEANGRADLAEQGAEPGVMQSVSSALLRYKGTDTVITVALGDAARMQADFEAAHQRQYGFTAREKPVVVDTLVVEVSAGGAKANETPQPPRTDTPTSKASTRFYSAGEWHEAPVFDVADLGPGHTISGPAIITEPTGSIVGEPNWRASVNPLGHLVLTAQGHQTH